MLPFQYSQHLLEASFGFDLTFTAAIPTEVGAINGRQFGDQIAARLKTWRFVCCFARSLAWGARGTKRETLGN